MCVTVSCFSPRLFEMQVYKIQLAANDWCFNAYICHSIQIRLYKCHKFHEMTENSDCIPLDGIEITWNYLVMIGPHAQILDRPVRRQIPVLLPLELISGVCPPSHLGFGLDSALPTRTDILPLYHQLASRLVRITGFSLSKCRLPWQPIMLDSV